MNCMYSSVVISGQQYVIYCARSILVRVHYSTFDTANRQLKDRAKIHFFMLPPCENK